MPALIVDPQLIARVTRQFQLRGQLQPFNLTENVVPIFDIGQLLDLTPTDVVTPGETESVRIGQADNTQHLSVASPVTDDGDISNDRSTNPGIGDVLADTGQLTAGLHWIQAQCFSGSTAAAESFDLEWRNAANTATLATYPCELMQPGGNARITFLGDFAVDERLRWVSVEAVVGDVATFIAAPASALQVAT